MVFPPQTPGDRIWETGRPHLVAHPLPNQGKEPVLWVGDLDPTPGVLGPSEKA